VGRFVLAPLIYAEAIGDLASPPKDGKSTLLRAMVRAKVTGTSFLGYVAPERSPVVVLSEERKHSLVEGLQAAGLTERDDVHVALARDLRAATWPQAVEAAWRLCEQVGATWLICDTVHGLARLPEELENTAAGSHLSLGPLKPVAEAGLAVTTTRHHRKSGGSVVDAGRGSGAFAGEVDILTAVRLVPGMRHVRELESIGRFRDLPERVRVELVREPEGDTFRLLDDEAALDPVTVAVLGALPALDESALDLKSLAINVGLSESTVQRALDPLVETGVVGVLGNGRRGNPRRYYRTTNGWPS
jgi:DNA-binding transcriptional ArsR family regulator